MRKISACIVAAACFAGICSIAGCGNQEDNSPAPETQSDHDKNLKDVMDKVSRLERLNPGLEVRT